MSRFINDTWMVFSEPFKVGDYYIVAAYIWTGLLVKYPVIWQGNAWVGNVCGVNFHKPGYIFFNRPLWTDLISTHPFYHWRYKNLPTWINRVVA